MSIDSLDQSSQEREQQQHRPSILQQNHMITLGNDSIVSLEEDKNSVNYQSIFQGSTYQSPEEIRTERSILFENMGSNKFIVTPGDNIAETALALGMPTFKIIEVILKEKKPETTTSKMAKVTKTAGVGSVELFSNLNKEAHAAL